MTRIALGIEYDGTNYYGWQRQKNIKLPTIQQKIETAISKVADQKITTICAGRTDAKVHAMAQVLHFDTTANRQSKAWVQGVNRYLPSDIRILWSQKLDLDFNARKSAIYRTYYYYICHSNIKPGLLNNYVTWCYKNLNTNINLNLEHMQQASNFWLGEHDFTSFRGKDCQSKTVFRTINNITISKQTSEQIYGQILGKSELIKIAITANAFLQHMVRNMVGVLLKIGQNKASPEWAKEVLLAKNRQAAAITAPPEGLYLAEVGYPKHFNLQNKSS